LDSFNLVASVGDKMTMTLTI